MNFIFRVDASSILGVGHLMRCLSLSQLLTTGGDAKVWFVCGADLLETLRQKIVNSGAELILVDMDLSFNQKEDAKNFINSTHDIDIDWIIVDHYGIDITWESQVRGYTNGIIVIDDLVDRVHDCDIVINQNFLPNLEERYTKLVPSKCAKLLGPQNLLIRQEFYDYSDYVKLRTECKSVLVNFGGSDPTNELSKVLSTIEKNQRNFQNLNFYILAGSANPRYLEIQKKCEVMGNVTFYRYSDKMAFLLTKVDLAIGAGGISLWERCFMGVPSVTISIAENQTTPLIEAEKQGLIWNLGPSYLVNENMISQCLEEILNCKDDLTRKSNEAIDFMGPIRRRGRGAHPILSLVYASGG